MGSRVAFSTFWTRNCWILQNILKSDLIQLSFEDSIGDDSEKQSPNSTTCSDAQQQRFKKLVFGISFKDETNYGVFKTLQTILKKVKKGDDRYRNLDGSKPGVQNAYV